MYLSKRPYRHILPPCAAFPPLAGLSPLSNANLAGPMVQQDGKDYFVEEPVLTNIGDDAQIGLVLPTRWFMQQGKVWAKIHHLQLHPENGQFVVDAHAGNCNELPVTAFFSSYAKLKKDHHYFTLPDPDKYMAIQTHA
jgi:hypothetical protein